MVMDVVRAVVQAEGSVEDYDEGRRSQIAAAFADALGGEVRTEAIRVEVSAGSNPR